MNILYTNGTDRWLSPPGLVQALWPFDLDPCAEPWMPWRTAARMLSLPPEDGQVINGRFEAGSIVPGDPRWDEGFAESEITDGLLEPWEGRVWMNHPYSCGLPWAEAMAEHGRGIALTAAKSMDTRWGQRFLESCSLALFLAGRILFHYPDGARSTGKWLPNALWAFGDDDAEVLLSLTRRCPEYAGVYMKRVK
jgi:hypothetical protein